MSKEQVRSPEVQDSPRFYSQAIKANGFLFVAGQVALDKDGNLVGEGDVVGQCRQALGNIKALAEAAGASMDDVVKITIFLRDVNDAAAIRPVRREYFAGPDYPATTLIGNVALALPEWLIEVEATVAL